MKCNIIFFFVKCLHKSKYLSCSQLPYLCFWAKWKMLSKYLEFNFIEMFVFTVNLTYSFVSIADPSATGWTTSSLSCTAARTTTLAPTWRRPAAAPAHTSTLPARGWFLAWWVRAHPVPPAPMRTAPAAPPATTVTCLARACAATRCPTPLTTTSVLRQTCRTWSCVTFCRNVTTASASTGSLSVMTSGWIIGSTRRGGRGCCWLWKVINISQTMSTCSWGCLYRSALPRTALWTPCYLSISIHLGEAIQRVGSCPLTRTTTQTGRGLN